MPGGNSAVDLVCAQRDSMPMALTVMITMGVLLAFSLVFVSPGDETFPIVVFDGLLILASLVFFGGSYWYCTRRAMDE